MLKLRPSCSRFSKILKSILCADFRQPVKGRRRRFETSEVNRRQLRLISRWPRTRILGSYRPSAAPPQRLASHLRYWPAASDCRHQSGSRSTNGRRQVALFFDSNIVLGSSTSSAPPRKRREKPGIDIAFCALTAIIKHGSFSVSCYIPRCRSWV